MPRKMNQKSNARKKAEFIYNLRYFIDTLPYHFLVMGSVFLVSFIFGKWFEAVCFLTAFFSLRYKFETTYHCDSMLWCMVFTNLIFALSIILCPPIYMYIFASIIFAYIDCLILWLIQDRKEKMFHVKHFDINHLTQEQVIGICNDLSYNKDKQDLAIMFFVERRTNKDVWNILCSTNKNVEWDTVTKYKYRITKDLKQYIKEKEQV